MVGDSEGLLDRVEPVVGTDHEAALRSVVVGDAGPAVLFEAFVLGEAAGAFGVVAGLRGEGGSAVLSDGVWRASGVPGRW